MLKINVSAGTLEVRWNHNNNQHQNTQKLSFRRGGQEVLQSSTKCILTLKNGKKETLGEVEAESKLYYKDNYNKEIGRRVSLAYAIKADQQSEFPMLTDNDIELIQVGYKSRNHKKELV